MLAIEQLAQEANIHLRIPDKGLAVKNMVGAANLWATVNCAGFATTNNDTVHYDRKSFVGFTWRPHGSPICAEVYSTGKVNIPGGRRHQDVLTGYANLVPQLVAHSSAAWPSSTEKTEDDDPPDNTESLEDIDVDDDILAGWGSGQTWTHGPL